MIRRLARALLRRFGVDVQEPRGAVEQAAVASSPTPWLQGLTAAQVEALPDAHFYAPHFSPWLGYGDVRSFTSIARPWTLVSDDRCYVLLTLARQALALPGAWIECGVYKGGTAMLLAKVLDVHDGQATLHLFDTFQGMPAADSAIDLHRAGDYSGTSAAQVEARIRGVLRGTHVNVRLHPGWIPDTFAALGAERVALAHVDVDIRQSVLDCCAFLYPRMVPGGMIVFDDYGFLTCPGARAAVDEFFRDKPEHALVLHTGQAIVFKLPFGA